MAISAVLSPRLAWFSFLERFWDLFAMEKTLSKHISVQRFLVRPLLGSSFTLQGVGQLSVYDMEAMKRNQWLQTFWLCSRVFLFFYFFIIISHNFYIALFSALEQIHCAHVWFSISEQLFITRLLNIHRSGVLKTLAWLVPRETAAISARSVYTIQPCTMSLHAKPHT